MTYYAHSVEGAPENEWEPLEAHLRRVAEGDGASFPGAAGFAEAFDCREWGRLLGLWHDLGKYAPEFQRYLKQTAQSKHDDLHRLELRGSVNHALAGALHAVEQSPQGGRLFAYCISGHHAGLPNTVAADGEHERSGLQKRLKHPFPESEEALRHAPQALLDFPIPPPPALDLNSQDPRQMAFQVAFLTRMLFSCLVDADFLATERFTQPDRAHRRPDVAPRMMELRDRADAYIDRLTQEAFRKNPQSAVNHHRAAVVQACHEAAKQAPGFFSLTVPTGGGKTLSSLAFALRHAEHHGLRRLVIGIPFTSIIEQNASAYRKALADSSGQIVLEHHSNLDSPREGDETERSRLAAENWEAPVVVTTNVQLFESLFARRTSRCRKLHRLAYSVIVLDEAQALPANLLAPTLRALQELVTNYGCTVVLCTATQPALEKRSEFPIGIEEPRPILAPADRDGIFAALKRVEIDQVGSRKDEELAEELSGQDQVLCIVNTRRHAKELFTALCEHVGDTETSTRNDVATSKVGSCLHLSANMCPRHRSAVLRLIRRRLATGRPCRVVSTQLVEAGVDVDFPVVYRAMAGLDAIAQAAGRCNREGRLDGLGRVVVFEPDESERNLPHFIRQPIQDAREVLPDHPDPLSPEAQHGYFAVHYWKRGRDDGSGWDHPPGSSPGDPGVLECFDRRGEHLQFRQAADRYRLIADDQQAILIPYSGRGRKLLESLQKMPDPPGRDFDRKLQRLVVTVHARIANELLRNQILWPPEETHGRLALSNPGAYDRRLGLRTETEGWAPETLQV